MTEWNWDDALTVSREEGREQGREEGREQGREEGRKQGLFQTARSAFSQGFPIEVVQKITGLDLETLATLQPR